MGGYGIPDAYQKPPEPEMNHKAGKAPPTEGTTKPLAKETKRYLYPRPIPIMQKHKDPPPENGHHVTQAKQPYAHDYNDDHVREK